MHEAIVSADNEGLHRAAVLGLRLVGHDLQLRGANRRQLGAGQRGGGPGRRAPAARSAPRRPDKAERRRKLLELHYRDKISGELFADEEARIGADIELLCQEDERRAQENTEHDELFEQVAAVLAELDVDALWADGPGAVGPCRGARRGGDRAPGSSAGDRGGSTEPERALLRGPPQGVAGCRCRRTERTIAR